MSKESKSSVPSTLLALTYSMSFQLLWIKLFKRTPKILEDACLLKENLGNLNSTEVISLNIEKLPQKKDIALFQKKNQL